jgi:hypothetical protein
MLTATMRILEMSGTMAPAIQRRMRTVCVPPFFPSESRAVRHLELVRQYHKCDPLVFSVCLHHWVMWRRAVRTSTYRAGASRVELPKRRGQTGRLLERTWETRVAGACGRQALAATIKAANPGEAAVAPYLHKAVAGLWGRISAGVQGGVLCCIVRPCQ